MQSDRKWTVEIRSKSNILDINFKQFLDYKDLLFLFVRRDIVTVYKQTVLGPLWYIIQPILTTVMFTLVFSRIANISTDGIPPLIFYLLGVTMWGYFSECLNRTSNTFVVNQHIFGKVYFPRITVPASIIFSTLVRFGIQFLIFLCIWIFYIQQNKIYPNPFALFLPVVVMIMALFSMGLGMIFSSMTTKYRDLQFLLNFGIQLWMYATPIIYPISSIPKEYISYIELNPLTPLVESMRYGFLGHGHFSIIGLSYSLFTSLIFFFSGIIVFSKVEKTFMDSV